MNLRSSIYKLQKALAVNGDIITITKKQIYSEAKKCAFNKFIVMPPKGNKELYSSFSQVDLVKWLAERLKALREGES